MLLLRGRAEVEEEGWRTAVGVFWPERILWSSVCE